MCAFYITDIMWNGPAHYLHNKMQVYYRQSGGMFPGIVRVCGAECLWSVIGEQQSHRRVHSCVGNIYHFIWDPAHELYALYSRERTTNHNVMPADRDDNGDQIAWIDTSCWTSRYVCGHILRDLWSCLNHSHQHCSQSFERTVYLGQMFCCAWCRCSSHIKAMHVS